MNKEQLIKEVDRLTKENSLLQMKFNTVHREAKELRKIVSNLRRMEFEESGIKPAGQVWFERLEKGIKINHGETK